MKMYLWFRSGNEDIVSRCTALMNQAAGKSIVASRARMTADGEGQTDPPLYGVPVGRGTAAEASQNPGAAMVETVRSDVLSGPVGTLSETERFELLEFISQGVDIESDWYWNADSPDYGLSKA